MPPPAANASVGIAMISKGRPDVLDDTLASIFRQTLQPSEIVIVVPTEADLPRRAWGEKVRLITGYSGICVQRNKSLNSISLGVDYVAFFDDDFELKTDYLAEAVQFLDNSPGVMGLSGLILADGNINREEARRRVDEFQLAAGPGHFQSSGKFHSLYGCNMVIRRGILEREQFDENLPLYSFAEDYDLSVRIERHGQVGKFDRCVGVHLATPGGRVSEMKRGYAFVANTWYFHKKGVSHLPPFLTWVRFWVVSARTCLTSLGKIAARDRSIDWAGRLKGSLLAVQDVLRGRSHPKRVEEL